LGNFDVAVVAIGSDIRASIMATLIAKEMGVELIICKAKDELQLVAIISYTFFMPGTQSNTLYLAMNQAFGFSKMTIAVASSIALA
ncbi:hypothetical protein ACTPD5_20955, partial [Clostridioides difficile]